MPPVRSLASKYYTRVVALILLLSEIMPFCSCCIVNGLVYITIIAPFSHQPSSYFKCMKLNMRLTYNV